MFVLYRISYLWYSLIGFVLTLLIGLLVSYLTGFEDPQNVDTDLLSPPVRDYLNPTKPTKKPLTLHEKISNCSKATLIGIVNIGLDIEDEKIMDKKLEKEIETQERKQSVISAQKISIEIKEENDKKEHALC